MFEKIKKLIDNYWYYYKWYVLGGLFLLFALVIVITQSLKKDDVDVSVVWTMNGYVGANYLSEMETELEKYVDDINGDGEVNVRVILVTFTSDGGMPNSEVEFSMQQKLVTQLSAGDVYLVITDENTYDTKLSRLNAFEDLTQSYPDNEHVDGVKYYLKGTAFTENEKLAEVIGDDVFMIIGSDKLEKLNPKDKAMYEKMRTALDRIITAG